MGCWGNSTVVVMPRVAVQLLMHTFCGFVVANTATDHIVTMYGTLKLHCAAVHIAFKQ